MSLRIINLAAEKSPKAKESNSKEWVSYGDDNNYFEYLIDRYNGSAVNNAIISSVSDQIYGEGLSCTDENKKPLDHAKMKTIFKPNDLKRVSHDLKLLGQGAFNIVWNKGRTQILKAKHIPMQNLRPEKSIEGEIQAYYYSDDWSQYRKERYAPKRIETFTGEKGDTSQVLVIKPYASGYFYFSPVDYAGCLQWAEIDEEIGTYHLSNIQNGFAPTMMINFNNGQPTEDEQNHIENKVMQKLQGTKGKKWLISFNDDTTNATTIDSLPISEASEQYKFLSEEATRKILIGHKVTSPILFGIKDSTGLGNNADEIKTASQLWDNTVIRPYQNMILDAINEVLLVNGIILNTYFKTLQPIEFIETEGLDDDEKEIETGIDQYSEFSEFKDLKDIDTKPTSGMISEAKRGLELRREFGRGGTAVGVARARDISNGKNLSLSTIKRMYSFFSRHEKSTKGGQGYKVGDDGYPSAGKIAWLLWGGDAGFTWSKRKVEEIKNVEEDFYKCKPGCKKKKGKCECSSNFKDERPFLSDDQGDDLLDYLELVGEENDNDEWELISEEEVDTTKDGFHQFANPTKSDANPDEKSRWGDTGLYKVRYVYSKTSRKESKSSSRRFCSRMIELSSSGIEYRYEDIIKMGKDGINSEFAPKGKNTYNLFKYKGGVNCHHGWLRRIYFRKKNNKGRFLPNEGLENDKRVGNNPYVKQKGEEAKAMIDTPNKGRLN